MLKPTGPIHIVMRFSDAMMSVEDTIAEHKAILDEHGAVWIAKVGRPLGLKNINAVNQQIEDGIRSFLLLVQNVGKPGTVDYQAYKATIVELATKLPDAESELIPEYYHDQNIVRAGSVWAKLSKVVRMKKGELSNYKIASSGFSLPRTLRKSMAAMFVVCEGEGMVS